MLHLSIFAPFLHTSDVLGSAHERFAHESMNVARESDSVVEVEGGNIDRQRGFLDRDSIDDNTPESACNPKRNPEKPHFAHAQTLVWLNG